MFYVLFCIKFRVKPLNHVNRTRVILAKLKVGSKDYILTSNITIFNINIIAMATEMRRLVVSVTQECNLRSVAAFAGTTPPVRARARSTTSGTCIHVHVH